MGPVSGYIGLTEQLLVWEHQRMTSFRTPPYGLQLSGEGNESSTKALIRASAAACCGGPRATLRNSNRGSRYRPIRGI